MPPETVRPLALVAMLGGASYVLSGVVHLASPEQTDPFSRASDNLIQILLALSFLLTLAGFVALHVRQAGNYGGPRGWTGYSAAILPHWTAYLVAALAVIVFGKFGVVLTGLVWITLGYVLFSQRAQRPGDPHPRALRDLPRTRKRQNSRDRTAQ